MNIIINWNDEGHLATAECLKLLSQKFLGLKEDQLIYFEFHQLPQHISEAGYSRLNALLRHANPQP